MKYVIKNSNSLVSIDEWLASRKCRCYANDSETFVCVVCRILAELYLLRANSRRYEWLKSYANNEDSTHSILFERGADEWDEIIDMFIATPDREKAALQEAQPAEWEDCGCCGGSHPEGYTGDCRNDAMRRP